MIQIIYMIASWMNDLPAAVRQNWRNAFKGMEDGNICIGAYSIIMDMGYYPCFDVTIS